MIRRFCCGSVTPLSGTFDCPQAFVLRADSVADRSRIEVTANDMGAKVNAAFTMLGPGDAKGYPCNENVPRCAKTKVPRLPNNITPPARITAP